jgi:hypothetical protein
MTPEEIKAFLDHPEPPDDPDENAEFQEWIYIENGQRVTVRRPNPNYKPPKTGPPSREDDL